MCDFTEEEISPAVKAGSFGVRQERRFDAAKGESGHKISHMLSAKNPITGNEYDSLGIMAILG